MKNYRNTERIIYLNKGNEEVYGHSPVEIVVSNPTGGMDVCLL